MQKSISFVFSVFFRGCTHNSYRAVYEYVSVSFSGCCSYSPRCFLFVSLIALLCSCSHNKRIWFSRRTTTLLFWFPIRLLLLYLTAVPASHSGTAVLEHSALVYLLTCSLIFHPLFTWLIGCFYALVLLHNDSTTKYYYASVCMFQYSFSLEHTHSGRKSEAASRGTRTQARTNTERLLASPSTFEPLLTFNSTYSSTRYASVWYHMRWRRLLNFFFSLALGSTIHGRM